MTEQQIQLKLDEFKTYYSIKEEHFKYYKDKEYAKKELADINKYILFLENELLKIKKCKRKRNKVKKLTK